jgi:peroxiredoxin
MAERLAITQLLPAIELPSAKTGAPVQLRPSMGRTTVIVSVHSTACEGCRAYAGELASGAGEFEAWDARLVVVVPGPAAGAERFEPRFGTVLVDPAHRISSPADAGVIVADRWGQIYDACYAGGGHQFPARRQLEEWLKFLGTLCPE